MGKNGVLKNTKWIDGENTLKAIGKIIQTAMSGVLRATCDNNKLK